MSYEDVQVPIHRVHSHKLITFANGSETVHVMSLTFPDGSQSPLLAFSPTQWSDLIADMQVRLHAGLEDAQR